MAATTRWIAFGKGELFQIEDLLCVSIPGSMHANRFNNRGHPVR